MKMVMSLTVLMMIFFTFLTYHTKECDPTGTKMIMDEAGQQVGIANQCVLECGCFGNAIPLKAHESFLKDVILLILCLPILIWSFLGKVTINTTKEDIIIYLASIVSITLFCMTLLDWMFPVIFTVLCLLVATAIKRRIVAVWKDWVIAGAVLIICSVFQYYTLNHLPLKDYRPYAIGESISENMKTAEEIGETPPVYATEYLIKNIKTGADSTMLSSDWLRAYDTEWFKTTYEVTSYAGKEILISEGYSPRILDLEIVTYEGYDMTYDILEDPGYVFLHISNTLSATHACAQAPMNALANEALKSGHRFYAITNALYDEAETYRHEHHTPYDFLNCDQTELKIIVRSNPGLVLIKNGVVINKWAWKDIPTWDEVQLDLND
jgi:hypothetical protein